MSEQLELFFFLRRDNAKASLPLSWAQKSVFESIIDNLEDLTYLDKIMLLKYVIESE